MRGSKAEAVTSSGLRTNPPALQPLLNPPLALLHPGLPLGAELLRLFLLFRREDREDLAVQPRLMHGEVGFHRREILHHRANAAFVDGQRFDSLLTRVLRRAHPLNQRACLFLVLLGHLAYLLALRLGEIECGKRKSSAAPTTGTSGSARFAPTQTAAGTLSKRGSTRGQQDECGEYDESK